MNTYTIYYVIKDYYRAEIEADSWEAASDHIYEQAGTHTHLDGAIDIEDYEIG